ncbi:MAG: uracil-DNA glycosylase [Flavobacteriales bacterium]
MKDLIPSDWAKLLETEFQKDYFTQLQVFVDEEYSRKICYPVKNEMFKALNATSFDHVKVVILGQDPYHGKGQANGLAFSVNDWVQLPPSLTNIFKELKSDLGIEKPNSGNLERWAKQGVLLLNTVLTVREGEADSHKGKGWEQFTDAIISLVSTKKRNVVFLLWGNKAQAKLPLIDETKHTVLKSGHPSPLSAYRGFFGCAHFSKTNEILRNNGLGEIEW